MFWNQKLIGINDDEESLQIYSNELCKKHINEQVRFYLTSMNVLQYYIIEAGSLLNSVIAKDEISPSYIVTAQ